MRLIVFDTILVKKFDTTIHLISRENERYLKMGCSLLPRHAVLDTFRMDADAPNASSEWFSTIYGDPKTSGLGLISSGLGQLPNGSLLYMDIPRQSIFVDLTWLMMLHDPLKYDFDRG